MPRPQRERQPKNEHRPDSGFAAVDGLVALTVAGVLLAIALNSAALSMRSARSSLERPLAAAEAELRLLSDWRRLEAPGMLAASSASDSFKWRLSSQRVGAVVDGEPGLCAVSSSAISRSSRRTYVIRTMRFCGQGAAQ